MRGSRPLFAHPHPHHVSSRHPVSDFGLTPPPHSVRELDLAFSGNQCAYMLLYRSRVLGTLVRAPRGDDEKVSIPPVVPAYWREKMEEVNEQLVVKREE